MSQVITPADVIECLEARRGLSLQEDMQATGLEGFGPDASLPDGSEKLEDVAGFLFVNQPAFVIGMIAALNVERGRTLDAQALDATLGDIESLPTLEENPDA